MIDIRTVEVDAGRTFDAVGAALDRLIRVAMLQDGGGARRIADFLLAWHNGPENGHFQINHLTYVDREHGYDMLTIMSFLNENGVHYPDHWGRKDQLGALVERWRS